MKYFRRWRPLFGGRRLDSGVCKDVPQSLAVPVAQPDVPDQPFVHEKLTNHISRFILLKVFSVFSEIVGVVGWSEFFFKFPIVTLDISDYRSSKDAANS